MTNDSNGQPPIPRRELYPPHETQTLLGISRDKYYRLQRAGKLAYVVVGDTRMTPHEVIQRVKTEGAPLTSAAA